MNDIWLAKCLNKILSGHCVVIYALAQSWRAGFPIYVGISLCHARGLTLREASQGIWMTSQVKLSDEVVALPECIIDGLDADLPTVLKPIFDILWNAFGYLQSLKYDQQGKWKGSV